VLLNKEADRTLSYATLKILIYYYTW